MEGKDLKEGRAQDASRMCHLKCIFLKQLTRVGSGKYVLSLMEQMCAVGNLYN